VCAALFSRTVWTCAILSGGLCEGACLDDAVRFLVASVEMEGYEHGVKCVEVLGVDIV